MRAELASSVMRRQLATEASGESKAGLYFTDRVNSQALPVWREFGRSYLSGMGFFLLFGPSGT